jgi:outer membrane protein assembly factor BamA
MLLAVVVAHAGAQAHAETIPQAGERPAPPPAAPSPPQALPPSNSSAIAPATPPRNPQFLLESVRVDPSGGDAELLVRRYLPLRAGQMVDAATLLQARRYLAATGLFTEVDLYTVRGSRPGAITAVVAARTSRRFYLETGVGQDPFRGWYWTVASLRRTGLLGRGGTARVSYRTALTALRPSGLYAELDVPSLLARDMDLLANLGRYTETWTMEQGDSTHFQKIDRARFRVGARHWLTDDLSAILSGGISQARPRQTLSSDHDGPKIPAAGLVPVFKDDLRFGEVQASLVRDRQDRLRPWQSGSWAGWILRGAIPREGERFWASELDARLALPVADTRAAAFRFRAVYTSADTPYFLRPIIGGIGSLRGFPNAGLSGPLGARAACSISAEWRHPLAGSNPRSPRVIGTLFADGGDHWTASGRRADPAASAGCGALVRVPFLQIVNLELAYPLTDQVKGRPARVALSLGRSF